MLFKDKISKILSNSQDVVTSKKTFKDSTEAESSGQIHDDGLLSRLEPYFQREKPWGSVPKLDLDGDEYGGINRKVFARVNDDERGFNRSEGRQKKISDSHYFGELWKSLMSGNSHYKTIYNDMLIDQKPYIPSYVSTMVKYVGGDLVFALREYVGAKICNLFGVDTVFNGVTMGELPSNGDPSFVVLSVDCTNPNEQTLNASDAFLENQERLEHDEEFNKLRRSLSYTRCKNFIEFFHSSAFAHHVRAHGGELTEQNLQKLTEDYIEQFFVRFFVLGDPDYCGNNVHWAVNYMTHDVNLQASMDMECGFIDMCKDDAMYISENIEYLMNNYPDIFNKLVEKYRKLSSSGQITKVIESVNDLDFVKSAEDPEMLKTMIANHVKQFLQVQAQLSDTFFDMVQWANAPEI